MSLNRVSKFMAISLMIIWSIMISDSIFAQTPTVTPTSIPSDTPLQPTFTPTVAPSDTPSETATFTPLITSTPTITTTPTETPIPNILNVPGDYATIQAAIDAAENGDIVRVADGTYKGSGNTDLDFQGKAITVESANGAETCIIDCGMNSRAFYFHTDETVESRVIGFTITNGNGGESEMGAAIYCEEGSPYIFGCIITENVVEGNGGGISSHNKSSPVIVYCFFEYNSASKGGAIYCHNYASAIITSCYFTENIAKTGGAIYCHNEAFTTITDCWLVGNMALDGGGLYCHSNASSIITNCLIIDNLADIGGGLHYHNNASSNLTNCTFSGNEALTEGGGMYCNVDSLSTVSNSIMWDDEPNEIGGGSEVITVEYSDIEGGFDGDENIDEDPVFILGPLGDYYLSQAAAGHAKESPCLDIGNDLAENICFDTAWGEACMSERTTRSDAYPDEGIVDLGFHYPAESGCEALGVRIYMPLKYYRAGDECFCDVYVCNPDDETYTDTPLFVLLDVYGEFYFAPTFTGVDFYVEDVVPGETLVSVIPHFIWPEGISPVSDIIWYAAMTNKSITEILGEWDMFIFGWGE